MLKLKTFKLNLYIFNDKKYFLYTNIYTKLTRHFTIDNIIELRKENYYFIKKLN